MDINAQEKKYDGREGIEKFNDNDQILRRSIKDQYKATVSPFMPPIQSSWSVAKSFSIEFQNDSIK